MFSKTYQLGPGSYLASFLELFGAAPGLSGLNGTAPDRTYIFREAAWAKCMVVWANRAPDKLEVCDLAILLKPRNEAKVPLCLSDGGRLSVAAFAPARFRS